MEGIAFVGLASSVVKFVQFGILLCKEIREYTSAFAQAPQKVKDIERRVTLILKTLADVEDDGKAKLDQERRIIEDSNAKVKVLLMILDKLKLTPRPSKGKATSRDRLQRSLNRIEVGWKAFKGLHGDEKIKALQLSLDGLLALLASQLQIKVKKKLDVSTEAIIRRIENLDLDVRQGLNIYEQAGEIAITHFIPFMRNARFIGREEIIKKLEEKIGLGESQVALCGLGGEGKTQIALKYMHFG